MTVTIDDRTAIIPLTNELLDEWAIRQDGPVALHLQQELAPVDAIGDDDNVVYPPTYADIGYNIDTLSDGTKVALIDSVGSQANRMEPIFKAAPDGEPQNPLAELVPQIQIVLQPAKKSSKEAAAPERRSILDLAHRGADAVVQSSPGLVDEMGKAFEALRKSGNAAPLCALAPTSLVFGVWDSRGGTGEKRPRLVRAIIRAWDVELLHAAAQFNSIWKALDDDQREELDKEARKQKVKLSVKGLKDAPAVFRTDKVKKFSDFGPNPEARVLGGVFVRGKIKRDVTVNLVALRGIRGDTPDETARIHKYLLGLSLLAATAEIDLFLREGCHLRYTGIDLWHAVSRRGQPQVVALGSTEARAIIERYATASSEYFKARWPKSLEYNFDLKEARKLLATKEVETADEE